METTSFENKPEEELWLEYKKTGNAKIREFFIIQYAPLVKYVASKIAVGKPGSIEFDDLVSYGIFGLFDAIDKYDPEKNIRFNTYAVTRIRGAIYDELRSIDWVPRSVRQQIKQIEDTIAAIEAKLGRSATDEEIAFELNISLEEYHQLLLKISGTSVISLADTKFGGEDSGQIAVGDSIEAPASLNPDVIVEREEIKRVIVEAIKELSEREQQVLILYYYEDMTLKEIGKVLKVTESRVSQIHTSANLKLKAKLTNIKRGIR
ncbi:RNA polymerase sigma factor WhiG [Treponema phagedenis]|uniref:RNA polymerase sigma factor WhiG n=1 Tax=Treponema phagedenis TaxID=162 RepID=A0A0B7GXP6_TREPH|nr:RNA polymerase sigma factor WhiG [Treponema phagedenis]EFW36862.1 RNA polymerase sigma factor, FliA/WhiG family [Treponema phagedenis F0421]NVP24009.1 RNA polymerase sigma factor WhiG [Treponema phagedenis]QEJ93872.1 RNA polymerase sigma factor WhiG [Treponema phagedenis]QEJ99422.1 RNA polymerase sigma factor WhiG [Treponema phagedenis]QEJ99797.1 RNA polymerase sigma factor WhiG [Treponema phagedenis]